MTVRKDAAEVPGHDIFRRNRSGTPLGARQTKITKQSDISSEELSWMHTRACFLKAADKSYNYIGDNLGVTTAIVRSWFDDEKLALRAQVTELQSDWIQAVRSLAEAYAIEALEGLMEIARTATTDPDTARKCFESILDRVGMIKVTKSESTVTKTGTTVIDGADFFEKIKGLPIETQNAVAALSAEMEKLIADAVGKE